AATATGERRSAATAAAKPAPGSLQPLAPCPREGCGGQLIEGRKGYGCTHYKQGCGFVIWKEFSGKKISPAMLNALLTKGQTQMLSFKRDGGEVKGRILLADRNTGKLTLEQADSTVASSNS
ncbi:topoisomerase C-terminal repeat-containing protein, partial [Paenibacillus timonensis]